LCQFQSVLRSDADFFSLTLANLPLLTMASSSGQLPGRKTAEPAAVADSPLGQGPADASFDDDVSSETTIEYEEEEDMKWTVEDVLMELPAIPGVSPRYFLVYWTGYGLHDATWEPEEHLEAATRDSWEATKAAIERGEKEEFDLSNDRTLQEAT
jgi:hypothetical protein